MWLSAKPKISTFKYATFHTPTVVAHLTKPMKTEFIIIIVLLILAIGIIIWRKKLNKMENAPTEFVKLKSKTESTKHLPLVSNSWISEIEEKWSEKEWGFYDNEHYDISNEICNNVYSKNKYWEKNQTHAEFLDELTKQQRVYFTLVNFEGQVNNGGVYQLLFNNPELSIIALQGMQEVGLEKLAKDYEIVLVEYFGKFNTIQELYLKFQKDNEDWNKRWNSFAEGYKELSSSKIIEEYFYKESFVKVYQKKLTEYVKANPTKLYRIK